MEQPIPAAVASSETAAPMRTGPTFYITGRQRLSPGAILLALLLAGCGLYGIAYGLGRGGRRHLGKDDNTSAARTNDASGGPAEKDKDDDPNQVDTIVLGDAADAPVPARKGQHISDVHATILIRLPRYGEQSGLIPDVPAGHLLFQWLAAFNQGSLPAMQNVLPNTDSEATAAAQMELRRQTGGFYLVSAKEAQPGVIVFRLRDQTPDAHEVLGTLQMLAGSSPPAIASFSLRAVPQATHKLPATSTPAAR